MTGVLRRTLLATLAAAAPAACLAIDAADECGGASAPELCPVDPLCPAAACPAPTALATGAHHACALGADAALRCWGRNHAGQLGDGSLSPRRVAGDVVGLDGDAAAVAAGFHHTCALMTGGAVHCWGRNDAGQLGDGTRIDRAAPHPVAGLPEDVIALAAGGDHTCAATRGGQLWCWGRNDAGQLGSDTPSRGAPPRPVPGVDGAIAAVALGHAHTCAATAAGELRCWGRNDYGQLGDGSTLDRAVPGAVRGLAGEVTALSAGAGHTCAALVGGALYCWGANDRGQLGDGTPDHRAVPAPILGPPLAAAAAAGGWHTCGRAEDGRVVCWGYNRFGQLGDAGTEDRAVAQVVEGLPSGVAALSAGPLFTCALTSDHRVLCWGRNDFGQLGDGSTRTRTTPTPVAGL